MDIELREAGGVLQAVADLYPITGETGAEIVINDYTLIDEELDEDGLVAVYEELVFRMLKVLNLLGHRESVALYGESGGNDELDRAMKRVLQGIPEKKEEVLRRLGEGLASSSSESGRSEAGDDLKSLSQAMKEEGLRRGLNKEERKRATLGELFDLEE